MPRQSVLDGDDMALPVLKLEQLARMMGGAVTVTNEPGESSVFTVCAFAG